MELVRRFGGYTLRLEISAEERHESSLDDGLEDRTHDDAPYPYGYPRDQIIEDVLALNDSLRQQLAVVIAERDALQQQNDQLRARRGA